MNYTLEEIFNQAKQDGYSVKIDGEGYSSVILYGIKIVKDEKSSDITILNTGNNLYYYSNVNLHSGHHRLNDIRCQYQ